MKATSVVVFALTVSALTGCGAAPERAAAPTENADAALDADEAPPQLASILSLQRGVVGQTTRIVAQLDEKVRGDVLVGSFILGCGIGLQHGPFATSVDGEGAFAVTIDDSAANMMLIGALVDVDADGAFDADRDVVLSAGGYEGLDGDGDGVVALSVVGADDWLRDTLPAVLLQATTTTVE